jgi:predicted nucleic acid-binding protein
VAQLAFVRLSANPSYSPDFVTPQEADTLLVRLTAHPRHRFRIDLPTLDADALRHVQGHQQVMDAYLVHLARHHRGRVVTTFDARLAAHAIRDHQVSTIGA